MSKHSLCPVSISPFQNRNEDFTTFPDLLTSSSSRLTHTANLQFPSQYLFTSRKHVGGNKDNTSSSRYFFHLEIIECIYIVLVSRIFQLHLCTVEQSGVVLFILIYLRGPDSYDIQNVMTDRELSTAQQNQRCTTVSKIWMLLQGSFKFWNNFINIQRHRKGLQNQDSFKIDTWDKCHQFRSYGFK